MNDDFYIGWQAKAPARTAKIVRCTLVAVFIATLACALMVALSQNTIGRAVFDWGNVQTFSGVLKAEPVPHLLLPDPVTNSFASYYLVNPWKFGFDATLAKQFDGEPVKLRGKRIYRDDQAMIEVERGSVTSDVAKGREALLGASSRSPVSLGEQTFIGEIVDSKCFLGVMNPGQLKPHRACAVRCISGGVPPVLLVRAANGATHYLLLVARDGTQVNQHVLDLVAEPVCITGEVVRNGKMLMLRADPSTYRRVP
jgi:hypothetical protein